MATMTTLLPPPAHRGATNPTMPAAGAAPQAQPALAELSPDARAAADEALAELFPALRLRQRATTSLDAGRR